MTDLMRKAVSQGAANAAQLPGQVVYGHAGIALSGPEGSLNAWFIGFVPRPEGGAVAVAVLIEDADQPDAAAEIGGQVLQAALGGL
jgi:beta-lactamase class D